MDCHTVENTMEPQTLRFICTNNGVGSDCDDMMEDGISGTILEMPCGAAKYAVAHDVYESDDQTIPQEFEHMTNTTVKELSFSYRFDLVRRDSGEIYLRADYSNIAGYWNAMVDSPPSKRKRSTTTADKLDRRFWSTTPSKWGQLRAGIDSGVGSVFSSDLTATLVRMVLSCGSDASDDAFIEILSSGTASGSSRMGISLVGTISPDFNIQEINAFMDTQLDVNLNLDFAMYGQYGLPFTTAPLLSGPLQIDEFNHIGLLSIVPTLEMDVSLSANQGSNIAANFSTGLHAFTSQNIVQAFPGSALPSSGQTNQQTVQNTFSGEVFDASGGGIKVDVQPKLGLAVTLDTYGTTGVQVNGFVQGGFDSYNALNINNDKSFSVQMGTGAGIGDLEYTNSPYEFTPWSGDAGMSRSIGSANAARYVSNVPFYSYSSTTSELPLFLSLKERYLTRNRTLHSGAVGEGEKGNGQPGPHYFANDPDTSFGRLQNNPLKTFLTCPSGLSSGKTVTCPTNLCTLVPGFCNDDDSVDSDDSVSKRGLTRRGLLAKRGAARDYTVDLGNGQTVVITSRPYPSRGSLFNGANGRQVLNAAFGFLSDDCEMTDILDSDPDDVDIEDYVTEHILEVSYTAKLYKAS